MDLLFNGCDVDCRSDDFNSKAICSVFEGGDVKAIWPKGDEEDMFLFAIMGGVHFKIQKFAQFINHIC